MDLGCAHCMSLEHFIQAVALNKFLITAVFCSGFPDWRIWIWFGFPKIDADAVLHADSSIMLAAFKHLLFVFQSVKFYLNSGATLVHSLDTPTCPYFDGISKLGR